MYASILLLTCLAPASSSPSSSTLGSIKTALLQLRQQLMTCREDNKCQVLWNSSGWSFLLVTETHQCLRAATHTLEKSCEMEEAGARNIFLILSELTHIYRCVLRNSICMQTNYIYVNTVTDRIETFMS